MISFLFDMRYRIRKDRYTRYIPEMCGWRTLFHWEIIPNIKGVKHYYIPYSWDQCIAIINNYKEYLNIKEEITYVK